MSDRVSRGDADDKTGPVLAEYAKERLDGVVTLQQVVPDEVEQISDILRETADSGRIDLIITTGGTGFGVRDVTPEVEQHSQIGSQSCAG